MLHDALSPDKPVLSLLMLRPSIPQEAQRVRKAYRRAKRRAPASGSKQTQCGCRAIWDEALC